MLPDQSQRAMDRRISEKLTKRRGEQELVDLEGTEVRFREATACFDTQQEAYEWLLNKILAVKFDFTESELREIHRRTRTRFYIARSPGELWDKSVHLAEEKRYKKMPGGWYANMNLDRETKFKAIRRIASAAQLKEGDDWTWDMIPKGIAIDLNGT